MSADHKECSGIKESIIMYTIYRTIRRNRDRQTDRQTELFLPNVVRLFDGFGDTAERRQ